MASWNWSLYCRVVIQTALKTTLSPKVESACFNYAEGDKWKSNSKVNVPCVRSVEGRDDDRNKGARQQIITVLNQQRKAWGAEKQDGSLDIVQNEGGELRNRELRPETYAITKHSELIRLTRVDSVPSW